MIARAFHFLILVFSLTLLLGQPLQAADPPQIEVLDFHGKHRCRTCIAIEEMTRETLNQQFGRELKAQRISFRLVDAEAEANAKLVRELEVAGTALILIVHHEGKRTPIDLTSMAFMNAHDRKAFQTKLAAEIKKHL